MVGILEVNVLPYIKKTFRIYNLKVFLMRHFIKMSSEDYSSIGSFRFLQTTDTVTISFKFILTNSSSTSNRAK